MLVIGLIAFAVSAEIIVDEPREPLTATAAALLAGRDYDLPGGLLGLPGAPDRVPPLAVGLGAVVACWTTALPGVLAVVATAVCLAGIGMWYTRDAAGAIRTMGA